MGGAALFVAVGCGDDDDSGANATNTPAGFKVRTEPDSSSGREFTSQFFFDEATVDAVLQASPYNQKGSPDVRNANDNIYRDEMLLPLTGDNTNGYTGTYHIGVDFA